MPEIGASLKGIFVIALKRVADKLCGSFLFNER